MPDTDFVPRDVLGFWFPEDGHWNSADTHNEFWRTRMQGGMDQAICERFGPLTESAARGDLDDWAETPQGRLALLIALDQFPRSYWRGTPGAYAQDLKSTRLALEGIGNGHYDALTPVWERQFYIIAISHCEGPDHLERMEMVVEMSKAQARALPPQLEQLGETIVGQAVKVHGIIAEYGRHPHRNAILGRLSTAAEKAYIAEGVFPHERQPEDDAQASG